MNIMMIIIRKGGRGKVVYIILEFHFWEGGHSLICDFVKVSQNNRLGLDGDIRGRQETSPSVQQ